MSKIPLEVAQVEIEKWLDFKKVKTQKRENNKEQLELITDAICDGTLVLDDKTFVFTHKLLFPLGSGDSEKIKELTYKPRLMVRDINAKMKGVKANDPDGRIVSYIAALTDQPSGIITSLDTEDNSLAQQIVQFFCKRRESRRYDLLGCHATEMVPK